MTDPELQEKLWQLGDLVGTWRILGFQGRSHEDKAFRRCADELEAALRRLFPDARGLT